MDKEKIMERIIAAVLVLLLLISLLFLFRWYSKYKKGTDFYEDTSGKYTADSDGEFNVDLEGLQQVNPDIKGWIYIEGTNISYPLLWSEDDDTYLRHTYTGSYSVLGSILIWEQNNPDFSDKNTLIFGHNTWNGQMFGDLKKYQQQSFYEEHPTICIITLGGTKKYSIVSAYKTTTASDIYTSSFTDDEQYVSWLKDKVDRSLVKTDKETVTGSEQTIVLSTCTGHNSSGRFVVVAELINS